MAKRRCRDAARVWAILCLAVAVSPADAAALADPGDPVRVVLLGDSITLGTVSGGLGAPYADVLAGALGPGFEIVNLGCGGASSRDWTLSRPSALCGGAGFVLPNLFEGLAVPALPSDFVTILLGTNDAIGFYEPGSVPPDDYREALEELVDNLLSEGARTIVVMTPPPRFRPDLSARLEAYRGAVLDICSDDPDVVCGPDLFELLEPSHFASHDVHPNAAGHRVIGIELALALLEITPVDADLEVFRRLALPGLPALVPAVIYSHPGFDAASEVDRPLLRFGLRGDEDSLLRAPDGCPETCEAIDVDGDGSDDLACAFELRASGLRLTSSEAWLMGRLSEGASLEGRASWAFGEHRRRVPWSVLRHLLQLSRCSRRAFHPTAADGRTGARRWRSGWANR